MRGVVVLDEWLVQIDIEKLYDGVWIERMDGRRDNDDDFLARLTRFRRIFDGSDKT